MSSPLMLEGQVDNRDETIRLLRIQVRQLDEALRMQRIRVGQVESGTRALRNVLTPLYRALSNVFGEMEEMGISESVILPQDNAKWESWKRKLGGKAAEFISELLIHGEMTGQQLKVATKCGQQTVYDTIAKLNKAQLLNKNGGKYSLKDI